MQSNENSWLILKSVILKDQCLVRWPNIWNGNWGYYISGKSRIEIYIVIIYELKNGEDTFLYDFCIIIIVGSIFYYN